MAAKKKARKEQKVTFADWPLKTEWPWKDVGWKEAGFKTERDSY